jgi:hypothetical protein
LIKQLWILLAVLLLSADAALAQQPCDAKTCSQARQRCETTRCTEVQGKHCESFCYSEFQRCLTTGEFRGHVCMDSGLIRK